MSLAVWLGEDRKCSAAGIRFRFILRVIYGTAVFIKSVSSLLLVFRFSLAPRLRRTCFTDVTFHTRTA